MRGAIMNGDISLEDFHGTQVEGVVTEIQRDRKVLIFSPWLATEFDAYPSDAVSGVPIVGKRARFEVRLDRKLYASQSKHRAVQVDYTCKDEETLAGSSKDKPKGSEKGTDDTKGRREKESSKGADLMDEELLRKGLIHPPGELIRSPHGEPGSDRKELKDPDPDEGIPKHDEAEDEKPVDPLKWGPVDRPLTWAIDSAGRKYKVNEFDWRKMPRKAGWIPTWKKKPNGPWWH